MGGIAAVVDSNSAHVDHADVESMTEALAHRGPDHQGFFRASGVSLGLRRLAIIDLSPGGNQPMSTEDEKLTLVFNGEVYNYLELRRELSGLGHRFRSQSDTEVVLRAFGEWGPKCLDRFNGMWAFCVWDAEAQTLFCARDRMGIKPLYYHWDGRRLALASEIKALLKILPGRPSVDRSLAFDFLALGLLDHTDASFFAGIRRVPPGHWLSVNTEEGTLQVQRYWSLPESHDDDVSPDEAAQTFIELLSDSVRLQLRADVPVGSSLSGRLGSSSLVDIVNDVMRSELQIRIAAIPERQKTFTATSRDGRFGERPYVDEVLRRIEAEGHFAVLEPMALWSDLPRLAYHQDEPFHTTSVYAQWAVMSLAAEKGMKVFLDGQGVDELLGGQAVLWETRMAELLAQLRQPTLRGGPVAAGGRPAYRWLAGVDMGPARERLKSHHRVGRAHSGTFPHLNPALLRYEDRNSMAFSLEARVPFLDHRLVEFAARFGAATKAASDETEQVVGGATLRLIPGKAPERRDDMGSATPEGEWMEVWRPLIIDLFSSGCAGATMLNRDGIVRRMLNPKPLGSHEAVELWRCVSFEEWLRVFDVAAA